MESRRHPTDPSALISTPERRSNLKIYCVVTALVCISSPVTSVTKQIALPIPPEYPG